MSPSIDGTGARAVFPFFVGCGRSGTTLLRAMIDSHPLFAVPAETQFILTLAEQRRRYEAANGFAIDTFLRDVFRHTDLSATWGIDIDTFAHELRRRPPKDYPDAVRSLFGVYAQLREKPLYANKTPIHVLRMPALLELFPDARFIHVIRDGRNVALSFLDSAFGPESIVGCALRWRRYVSRGITSGPRLGSGRYLEIRYEDLVREPATTARTVCRFIDVPFDDHMLRYFDRADEILGQIDHPESHSRLRLPPTQGLRDWRTEMSPDDAERFEAIAGSLLSRLGYERRSQRTGVALRFGAYRDAATEEFRRVSGALGRRLPARMHSRNEAHGTSEAPLRHR